MSTAQNLRQLLRPLGIYDLEAPFSGGELDAQGEILDGVSALLEEAHRESGLATAESWGLENIARLFARRPVAAQPRQLAAALAALLRIGGDSFTQGEINNTISGCGLPAWVAEAGVNQVEVSFPGIVGQPEGFEEIRQIVEDILPAHLEIVYRFWYLIWSLLENKFPTWRSIEILGMSWERLERCVE